MFSAEVWAKDPTLSSYWGIDRRMHKLDERNDKAKRAGASPDGRKP
jgi:hypothetical protein